MVKYAKTIIIGSIVFLFAGIIIFGISVLSSFQRNKPYKFGAVYMTMNNPYFNIINDEIQDIVERNGDHLICLDPALDVDKQIQELQYLIVQKVDVIFVNPVDMSSLGDVLEEAYIAGIPVIVVDAPVENIDYVNSTIVSDNYNAGVLCARDMINRVPEADIVLLEHIKAISAIDRIQGFLDTIEGMEGYRIIDRRDCEGQLEQAMPVMEEMLAQHDNIDVVMALNDPSAMGALAALESEGRLNDVLVYGVDGSPDTKVMINESYMTATAAQSPKKIGQTAAQVAYDLLEGKTPETEYCIEVTLITRENLWEYNIDGWQ